MFNTVDDDEEEEITQPIEPTVRKVERPVKNRVIKTSMKSRPVVENNTFDEREAQKQKEKENDNHIKVRNLGISRN